MRDVVVTAIVFLSLPVIVWRPWIGILVWNWIGIMNPHRLTWGFAYNMPFAQMVAIATIFGLLFSREPKRFPVNAVTVTLLALIAWMSFTHLFAIAPEASYEGLIKMLKVQFVILLGMVLMQERLRIQLLTWVLVLSIGFYGVKGGIFTLRGGGGQQVLGPEGSFISGNTEIGLAMLMMLPLMRYLQLNETRRWVRWGLAMAMILSAVAILGTQSRGALVGGAAMGVFFWLKSRNKVPLGIVMAIVIPVFLTFMPETWWARMGDHLHVRGGWLRDGPDRGLEVRHQPGPASPYRRRRVRRFRARGIRGLRARRSAARRDTAFTSTRSGTTASWVSGCSCCSWSSRGGPGRESCR